MKADKETSLLEYLQDDKVTRKLCKVRNEQIVGDSAYADILADSYPNGIRVTFVRENGEWKLTNRSPSLSYSRSFTLNVEGKHFIKAQNKESLDPVLNAILLRIRGIAEYCVDHKITGEYSETDQFRPLAELLQYLKM